MKVSFVKYEVNFASFSFLKSVFTFFILINMTACGGSSGPKSVASDLSSSNSSFTSLSSLAPASSANSSEIMSSVGSAQSSSIGANGVRLAQLKYDLDNNGVFDVVRSFRYNVDGSLADTLDTYVEDGVADAEFMFQATGLTKGHIDGRIETYFYNDTGYINSWIENSTNGRDEYFYEYAASGAVNYYRNDTYDASGERLNRFEFTSGQFTYNSKQQFVAVLQLLNIGWILTYNDAGFIEASDIHFGPFVVTSKYHWRSDGQLALIESDGGNYQEHFNYDASNRFVSKVIVNTTSVNQNVTQTLEYDGVGKAVRRFYDQGSDGTSEGMMEYVWEEGVCSERLLWTIWAQPNETRSASANDAFLAGTGYSLLGYCQK